MQKKIDVRKPIGDTKTITISKHGRCNPPGQRLKMVVEHTPWRINGKDQIVSRTRHVSA